MMKDNKMMSNNFRNTFNENQIYSMYDGALVANGSYGTLSLNH